MTIGRVFLTKNSVRHPGQTIPTNNRSDYQSIQQTSSPGQTLHEITYV